MQVGVTVERWRHFRDLTPPVIGGRAETRGGGSDKASVKCGILMVVNGGHD